MGPYIWKSQALRVVGEVWTVGAEGCCGGTCDLSCRFPGATLNFQPPLTFQGPQIFTHVFVIFSLLDAHKYSFPQPFQPSTLVPKSRAGGR